MEPLLQAYTVCLCCFTQSFFFNINIILLKSKYLLQERSRLPAPGDADELSVIEGQIAWMVHIIAAIVKVRHVTGAR